MKRVKGKPFNFTVSNLAKENRSTANALAAVRATMIRTDIGVLIEVENRALRYAVKAMALRYGFGVHYPGSKRASSSNPKSPRLGGAANAVLIVYRKKRFPKIRHYYTYFLRDGEAGNFPSKFIPFLGLKDALCPVTGPDNCVEVFGFHNVPGAWSGRIPKNRNDWVAINKGIIARTSTRDDKWDPPMTGGADTNKHRTDLPGLIERHLPGSWSIDSIFGANVQMTQAQPFAVKGSDHKGNMVTVFPFYVERD